MRVDFYQVSRDPAPDVVALLARNTLKAGERLLVVAEDPGQLDAVSEALWRARPDESFLANGRVGGGHEALQPILLSDQVVPINGARFVVLADGHWRDAVLLDDRFVRTFLVFDDATLEGARACWRQLGEHAGLERNFWKQEGGRWVKAA